jgi:hypothetical protein
LDAAALDAAALDAAFAAGTAAPFDFAAVFFGAVFFAVPTAMAWARLVRPSACTCLRVVSSVISKSSLSDRARMPIEAIAEPDVYLIASSK